MNNKGTRATNGEGYIGTTIQKIKKKFDNTKMCNICKNCKDRSKCNNRTDWTKCDLCKNCKEECLNYCDRFYCRKTVQAQITVDGKQVTVATKKTRKESVAEKKRKENDAENGYYISKSNITLYQICKKIENEKFKANIISANTVNRNKSTFKKIENSSFYLKPIQKTKAEELKDFFNSYRYLSQSEIDKIVNMVSEGFNRAVDDGIISYIKNPMKKIDRPVSDKAEKEVVAFELDEVITLIKYLLTHENLIVNNKCNYDSRTIRNLILIAFLSIARIGELGALYIDKSINLEKKYLIKEKTLTKDENGNVIMGTTTKTGKRQKNKDKRIVNFNIFSEELFDLIIRDQIENAISNSNNSENLLFCDKNGNYIKDTSISKIFKRICREAGVKLELPQGCHIHMTRHTGISLLICFGYELIFITIFSGHSSIREIERTYGHILNDYKKKKLENPDFKYTKEDVITKEILKLARERYKVK